MASPLLAIVGAYLLYYFGSIFNGYRKNIANAKASGFAYVILRKSSLRTSQRNERQREAKGKRS